MSEFKHQAVFLQEAVTALKLTAGMTVVDATFGGGGHTAAMLNLIGSRGKHYCFDQDIEAIELGKKRYAQDNRVQFINANFVDLKKELVAVGVTQIDAILFDLGVSSYQIDMPQRGFSWKQNCLLDMRMNQNQTITAQTVLNEYSMQRLTEIFKNYGEERYAKKIASKIVEFRKTKKITESDQLKYIVFSAARGDYQAKTTSVARIFQAVRIEVNNELAVIEKAITDAVDLLAPGGRIALISFHSLEDRIVKKTFQRLAKGCVCPPKFPQCVCGIKKILKLVNKKPILPTAQEISNNVRARSAKLRIGEKLDVSK